MPPLAKASTAAARPPVITDDMLHTVLRRRAAGESVAALRPDMIAGRPRSCVKPTGP